MLFRSALARASSVEWAVEPEPLPKLRSPTPRIPSPRHRAASAEWGAAADRGLEELEEPVVTAPRSAARWSIELEVDGVAVAGAQGAR